MGDMGGYYVHAPCRKEHFFSADDHFQFAFYDVRDLFVHMMVLGRDPVFFYVPEYEGAGVAMDHFAIEAGEGVFYRDIFKVLHFVFVLPKIQKKRMVGTNKAKWPLWISGKSVLV